jgi:hypothetical protein
MVPVALMVAVTSPRFTTAVRKDSLWSLRTHHHPAPAPTTKMAMATARTGLVRKRRMKSVYIGDILISPFSLFFLKPINDFLNYEKKLILAVLKKPVLEQGHFSPAGPNPAGAASNIEKSTS